MVLVLTSAALLFLAGSITSVLASSLVIYEESSFVDDTGTYKCFTFENGDGVAIAWNGDPTDTPDDTETGLVVPSSINYTPEGESMRTYAVKALAKGAFRYCDFKKVTLPTSIELISEESFAYCQKLKDFTIPYLVDEIKPSTFLDCRELEHVHYSDSNGNRSFGNSRITTIGDHAFDSCIKLKEFNCPTTTTYFGESCFQKCVSMVNFYFPSSHIEGGIEQYPITIRPYAFANCSSLIYIYFETNMREIDNYAFVGANSTCRIKYTGNNIPSYSRSVDGSTVNQTHWRDFYISTNQTSQIPVDKNQDVIKGDPNYPCLRYTVSTANIMLDSCANRTAYVTLDNSGVEYAIINKFDTPTQTVPGCYELTNAATGEGYLTIPDTLDGKPVKIIDESAFALHTEILKVTFNANLVQIKNNAFFGCNNISELNFAPATIENEQHEQVPYGHLREVSYCAFQDEKSNTAPNNTALTTLNLPDTLYYVGDYSFSRFVNVNTFHMSMSMKAIADNAFYKLGFNATVGTVELVLPKTLNDADAQLANFKHMTNNGFKHDDYTRWYAVGKYAFREAKCLATVTMEPDSSHINDSSYKCSFFSNTFHTCSNLVRFKASANACYLGKDLFKACDNLREIFLATAKADESGIDYPWNIDEANGSYGGTFFSGASPELVIYVDGASAPGELDTPISTDAGVDVQVAHAWNSESLFKSNGYVESYNNDIKSNDGTSSSQYYQRWSRSVVPTYYNVNLDSGVKYWNPKSPSSLASAPTNLAGYNSGIISFVKGSDNKYTAVRYYYSFSGTTGYAKIDLTSVPGISDGTTKDLTVIGDEAFATLQTNSDTKNDDRTRQPGFYFILPNTITTIGERAFYRKLQGSEYAVERYGVRIVTYKNDAGKIIDKDGTTQLNSLDDRITTCNSDKNGWCVIPNSVTKIQRYAFYNNAFTKAILGSGVTFVGNNAFTTVNTSSKVRSKSTTLEVSNANFNITNDGLYYVGGGTDKQMLLYQTQANTGGTDKLLTIKSDTKAIGFCAITNTSYENIELCSGLTTIYGAGMAQNYKLKKVTGVSSLRYIGAMENPKGANTGWDDPDYTEVWDSTTDAHCDNVDYRDYLYADREVMESLYGAFKDNTALTDLNFKSMSQLRKIGKSAFRGCSNLINMVGTAEYSYKRYNKSDGSFTYIKADGSTSNTKVSFSTNILDLSGASHLRCIDRDAFRGCGKIKFLHLPDNKAEGATQSPLYIGFDPENPHWKDTTNNGGIFNNNASLRVFIKETAIYANPSYGSGHSASAHYPANAFGTGNEIFYYLGSKADIPQDEVSSLKYWTYDSNGEIIIFDGVDSKNSGTAKEPAVHAAAYFDSLV